jgi:hypothetical protein
MSSEPALSTAEWHERNVAATVGPAAIHPSRLGF